MSRSASQRMGAAAVLLAGGILLSRLLGFLREAIIAYLHGASSATDAYYVAFQLPELMSYFLAAGTLSITFIPLFSSYIARNDEEGGWKLFSVVATTFGSILLFFVILAEIFAPQFVPMIAPGFTDPDQLELAILMTRIVLPAQLFFYFGGLLQATLFVREKFWPAAISPLIYNISIITCGVLLNASMGIVGFAVGALIGSFLGPFGLTFLVARKDLKFNFHFKLNDPGFIEFIKLSLPLMVGVGLVTIDQWLLNYFGTLQGEGATSWLTNGRKLMMVAFAIIGQASSQAALPFLTRLFHENKHKEMGEMMTRSLRRVSFLAAIAAVGLAVLAKPIVYTIFRRGAFTMSDADITAELLVFFSFGLVAWSVQTFAVRGFYARKDTLSPMIISTSVGFFAIPIYYLLHKNIGISGLAMATSIGITLNALATMVFYRYKTQGLDIFSVFKSILSGVSHGFIGGGAAYLVLYFYRPERSFVGSFSQLILGSLAFGFAVIIVSLFTKAEELEFLLSKIRKRINRNKA